MVRVVTLACCALNQWALDFTGNAERILKSIVLAKEKGASYRLGPELEVSGYGCGDHFLEMDTVTHSWEVLAQLLKSPLTRDIFCDIGMPVLHKNARYNCRVLIYNGQVLLIRPKMVLALDGNYREIRWFSPWRKIRVVEDFQLPPIVAALTNTPTVPFGDVVLSTPTTAIGWETCEELWSPVSPHTPMGLDGVEIFCNASGSHHQLRKLHARVELIQSATTKMGGVYMYSNLIGCDGERVYYDGSCLIALNGEVLAQSSQFTLAEVEVITATIDLDHVTAYRGANPSIGNQVASAAVYPRVNIDTDFSIVGGVTTPTTQPVSVNYHMPEEEISLGPACWLWDYLRRSSMAGFFLPLSGGIDSSSTAVIVASMCSLVHQQCRLGTDHVIKSLRKVLRLSPSEELPSSPKELANRLFTTCYMASGNSSKATQERAKNLAEQIGAHHMVINIDQAVKANVDIFTQACGRIPKFKVHGGSSTENLALQNVQARSRMVLSYLLAQLTPWTLGRSGALLVLGSANVDEALRGYFTKYDCSSADINPIGGISKTDLRAFCRYMGASYPELLKVLKAPPTAELEPITSDYTQTDEDDMGMTYAELSVFGRLRKIYLCGPYSMFIRLLHMWGDRLTPRQIAEKVRHFFYCYSVNRHKLTTLTPSYHAVNYSPDDNRFDLRPFLYNTAWTWQFAAIQVEVDKIERKQEAIPSDHAPMENESSDFVTAFPEQPDLSSAETTPLNGTSQHREAQSSSVPVGVVIDAFRKGLQRGLVLGASPQDTPLDHTLSHELNTFVSSQKEGLLGKRPIKSEHPSPKKKGRRASEGKSPTPVKKKPWNILNLLP